MTVAILPMREEHLPEVARLSVQLDYPATLEEVARRFKLNEGRPDHQSYVALLDGRLVGWVQLWVEHAVLVEERGVELAAMVVDRNHRSAGVGKALVNAGKAWARGQGVGELRLSSNVLRNDAHRFYLREGFILYKTSHFFSFDLGGAP